MIVLDGQWVLPLTSIGAAGFGSPFANAAFVVIWEYEKGGRVHRVICFWRLIQYKENSYKVFLSLVNSSINQKGELIDTFESEYIQLLKSEDFYLNSY